MVCVHGVTAHGGRFRDLAGPLESKRVVAVDLRGHGRSTWDAPWTVETHLADLLETADALGIGEATWIGHSFGGRLVAELAATNPERVERAVLLDPAMHIDPAIAPTRRGSSDRPLVQLAGRGDRRAAHGRHAVHHASLRSRGGGRSAPRPQPGRSLALALLARRR